MKLIKKLLITVTMLTSALMLASCNRKDNDYVSMSQSHFISVADSSFDVDWATDCYDVSYDMEIENTNAAFLLGDSEGEYGNLNVVQIDTTGDEACLVLNHMYDGRNKENDAVASFAKVDDGIYHVELSVDKDILSVVINGIDLGSFDVEDINLGAIGTYKSRGISYAYLDNVKVTDSQNNVLFDEDFEKDTNIFAPYYTKIEDGRMRVSSGVVTTYCKNPSAPVFRREFSLSKLPSKIKNATINMTALGSFDLELNGQKVNSDYFSPGKLLFNQYLEYVKYDVTDMLKKDNVWDISLFHGFYDRGVGFTEIASPWGAKRALKGELVIEYKNGEIEVIPTDELFKVTVDGAVEFDDIYQGEIYNASNPSLENATWSSVEIDKVDEMYLNMECTEKTSPVVTSILTLEPATVTNPSGNTYVYDFGQNFSGTIKIDLSDVDTKSDTGVITFRYGEALNAENMTNRDDEIGTVWTQNLLTAKATDYYICGDNKPDVLEFSHTYHGFRYLQISGIDTPIPAECITANVISSSMKQTGSFECSNDAVNRYYENSRFSVFSNFIDSPSDCNQRDERLGWTGDAQAVSEFAGYILDTKDFYGKYLKDIRLVQSPEGAFPDMAPRNMETDIYGVGGAGGNNCWGDAGVVITYNTYLKYGDISILSYNFDSCARWVDYLVEHSSDYIRSGDNSYGDHLSMQDTPKDLSDTAWSAHAADLVSRMAGALGLSDEESKYREIFEHFKEAWNNKYVRPDADVSCGILFDETQTAYALGIAFDLFDDDMKVKAAERLNILMEYSGYIFGAGYSGVNYLLPVLAEYGYADTAMKVLTNASPDNLMYTVAMGMTTTPEMLTCYTQNGDETYWINGSLNHYAYASVSAYCFKEILGLKPDLENPGYKHFYIEPKMGGDITSARGTYETPYGMVEISWEYDPVSLEGKLNVTVPEASSCTVITPDGQTYEMKEGHKEYTWKG